MRFLLLFLIFNMSGCSLWNAWDCWSIDGKAASSCMREKDARKACRKHKGLKNYSFNYGLCNDGTEVRGFN